ncbi:MAG: hypothetical protein CL726_08915 [Chloroflexi bacterium]|nr:hypothetical protein [Chloroflexota bacterium]
MNTNHRFVSPQMNLNISYQQFRKSGVIFKFKTCLSVAKYHDLTLIQMIFLLDLHFPFPKFILNNHPI